MGNTQLIQSRKIQIGYTRKVIDYETGQCTNVFNTRRFDFACSMKDIRSLPDAEEPPDAE